MLGSVWRYRHFILASVRWELSGRCARSWLDPSWFIRHPLAQRGYAKEQLNNGGRLFFEHALLYVKRRPRLKACLFRLLQMFPPIRRKALLFAENRKQSSSHDVPALPKIFIDPDPELVSIWLKISSKDTI